MSKMLDQAIAMLRELPEDLQDTAARQLMQYLVQISTVIESAESELPATSAATPVFP